MRTLGVILLSRRVAIVKRYARDPSRYLVYGRNLGIQKRTTHSKFLYTWDENSPPLTVEGFYGNVTTRYNGHKFSLMAHLEIWEYTYCFVPLLRTLPRRRPRSNNKEKFRCDGIDVLNMEFGAEMFNYTFDIVATNLVETSKFDKKAQRFDGVVHFLVDGMADVSVVLATNEDFNRILYPSYNKEPSIRRYIFAAAPKPLPKAFSAIYPYEPILWPVVFAVVVLMSIIFKVTPLVEKKVNFGDNKEDGGISLWYGFSSLFGQNMSKESSAYHKPSLR